MRCADNNIIQCDEQGPPCTNCRVRKLDCAYNLVKELSPAQQEQSPLSSVVSSNTRRCELELLHQWTSDTYRSLVFRNSDEHLWQVSIPRAALDQDYLLNAIFAMTSLHKSMATTCSESRRYQLHALEYHNLAFTAFQSEERAAAFESHQSLFAYSIINLVFVVALPSRLDRDIDQPSIIGNLSTMYSLLRGTTNIHRISFSWLSEGPFAHFLRSNASMRPENPDEDTQIAFTKLRELRDNEYTTFAASAESAVDGVRMLLLFTSAIDKLEDCFKLRDEHSMVVCFRWLALLEEEFINMVENREPFVLLVTMYWAILLDRIGETKWWAKSAGKTLVAETSRLVCPHRPLWQPVISWIHTQVGLPVSVSM